MLKVTKQLKDVKPGDIIADVDRRLIVQLPDEVIGAKVSWRSLRGANFRYVRISLNTGAVIEGKQEDEITVIVPGADYGGCLCP